MTIPEGGSLDAWQEQNPVRDEMLWKGAAIKQIERFREMGREMNASVEVVGHHTSKSIRLPVALITGTHGRFLLRDNFHDLNLCVLWDFPPDLRYGDLYVAKTWEWYLNEIERKRGYCYKGWTEEEMADPRILRVQVTYDNGNTLWREVKGDEKDRWTARMTSTAWFERDWSSGRLFVEGEMGPGCTLYRADRAFCQGISDVVPYDALQPWEPGKTQFTLALPDYDRAVEVMRAVNAAPKG